MQNNYSPEWKKRGDRTGLIRNALLKSMGYTDRDIEKPIIGIINTWAETNPGHYHFRQLSEAVKRGVAVCYDSRNNSRGDRGEY